MMDGYSGWQLLFCALVIVLAFAVRGGAGFGGGAVAVPLLSLVFPVQVTVPVTTILNMLSSIGQGVADRRLIAWHEIRRIVPASIVGVFAGLYLLQMLDPKPLAKALGIFVVVYAIYALIMADRTVQVPPRWQRPVAYVTSVIAGMVGSLFGSAAGPIYAIYLNSMKHARDVFRVTITMVMLFQGLTRIGGYAALGFYDGHAMLLLLAAVPLMVLGSWLGNTVVRRFNPARFSRAIGVVLLLSGVALYLK